MITTDRATMIRTLAPVLALVLAAGLAACGASSGPPSTSAAKPAEPAAPAASAAPAGDARAICVQAMTRSRECTETYIPALVDARAKLDVPAGIAAQVKADRAAVITAAKQEWATDSTDAAIAAMCDRMAATVAPDDVKLAKGCVAAADCGAFTSCLVPIMERHMAK
jgi:hypothetical protein